MFGEEAEKSVANSNTSSKYTSERISYASAKMTPKSKNDKDDVLLIEANTNSEPAQIYQYEKPPILFPVPAEVKTVNASKSQQEQMYEKVIYRFFDETPSMIEENSQEDEESKTYTRGDS